MFYLNGEKYLGAKSVTGSGINLLTGTQDGSGFTNYDNPKNFHPDPPENNFCKTNTYHLWGDDLTKAFLAYKNTLYLSPGVYTLSFLGRHNGNSDGESSKINTISIFTNWTDKHGGLPLGSTTITGNLEQHAITFKVTADMLPIIRFRIGEWAAGQIPGGSLYYVNLKLEQGYNATPYTPSFDDIVSDINQLKSKLGGGKA